MHALLQQHQNYWYVISDMGSNVTAVWIIACLCLFSSQHLSYLEKSCCCLNSKHCAVQCKINKGCGEQDGIRVADFQGSVQEEGRTKGRKEGVNRRQKEQDCVHFCMSEKEREREKRGRPRACVFVCKCVCALWYRDGSPALVSSPRPCLAERQRQPPFTLGRFKLSQAMVTSQGVSL